MFRSSTDPTGGVRSPAAAAGLAAEPPRRTTTAAAIARRGRALTTVTETLSPLVQPNGQAARTVAPGGGARRVRLPADHRPEKAHHDEEAGEQRDQAEPAVRRVRALVGD